MKNRNWRLGQWILVLMTIVLMNTQVEAQDYDFAIGLRAGKPAGITAKKMLGYRSGIEAIVGTTFEKDFHLAGLYEFHWYLNRGANLFAGAGMSMSLGEDLFDTSADAIIGLEYNFLNYPVNATLDWKPSYDIFGNNLKWDRFALSFRYILVR